MGPPDSRSSPTIPSPPTATDRFVTEMGSISPRCAPFTCCCMCSCCLSPGGGERDKRCLTTPKHMQPPSSSLEGMSSGTPSGRHFQSLQLIPWEPPSLHSDSGTHFSWRGDRKSTALSYQDFNSIFLKIIWTSPLSVA